VGRRDEGRGKLLSLAYFLREYRGALRSDFRHYYGMDLREALRGNIFDAADLAVNIPPGAAVWREHGGALAWTQAEHFAALQLHAANVANWQRTKDGQKGSNPPKPIEPPKGRKELDADTARLDARAQAFLARQKAREQPTE
jgi:Family of unknown function (DUF5361)